MADLSYNKPSLTIQKGKTRATKQQIRDVQRDLRQVGYLLSGIDGNFGSGSEMAVKALQYDLLHNVGESSSGDGKAPVRILDYNRGRVVEVTGAVEQGLAGCISDMLDDANFPKLPRVDDPVQENGRIITLIQNMPAAAVPIPFLMGILEQESGLTHYNQPPKGDEDTFIKVGLDTNSTEKFIITSRGYGAGQYTLFHHPPNKEEVEDFMLDIGKNVQKAINELKDKFDHYVVGSSTGTRADDRIVEHGNGVLVTCQYPQTDTRYMKDCKQCMINAGQQNIEESVTPLYHGSEFTYTPTQYYKKASYQSVPIRKNIPCDWQYAVRRYNGAGINSYHYQARVLKNVLNM